MDAGHTIRAAQPGDIEAIVALCGKHAAFEGADYATRGRAAYLGTQIRSAMVAVAPVAPAEPEVLRERHTGHTVSIRPKTVIPPPFVGYHIGWSFP